jgi:secreted trypsin-like serine protease
MQMEQLLPEIDSGGPVIVTKNGVKVVVGIISFANKNLPNVHTRVSSFYDWITENSLAGSCQQ